MNNEYTNTEPDDPDPIRAAVDNYERAPRDIVPPSGAGWSLNDLGDLIGQTVEVTHLTADGPVTETGTLTTILSKESNDDR